MQQLRLHHPRPFDLHFLRHQLAPMVRSLRLIHRRYLVCLPESILVDIVRNHKVCIRMCNVPVSYFEGKNREPP